MADATTQKKKTTLGGVIFSQSLALLFFVIAPGAVTAIAPVTWVKFQRTGERVTARAQVCLFFVVPYKTMTVNPVIGIGDRFAEGTESRERRKGRDKFTKSEDEAFLVIHGENQSAELPVTPVDIKSVTERTDAFLRDSQATELKLFVVANWKFSVIGGGLASLLTVIYVLCVVVGGLVATFRGVRRMSHFATAADVRPADGQSPD
jgi:hypothetical protein